MTDIPSSDWTWINDAADRFERVWKQGPRPRIEDYLAEVEEHRPAALLVELLRVKCELRRRAGEEPGLEEYASRFPEHAARIEAILDAGPGRSVAASTPTGDPGATNGLAGNDGVPASGARPKAVYGPEQRQVIRGSSRGLTVEEIATALGVSRRTAFRYLAKAPAS